MIKTEKEGPFFRLYHQVPDEEGNDVWEPVANAPLYSKFQAAIAWLDPQLPGEYGINWLCVIGRREDGIYAALEEFSGSELEICLHAVSVKDRYWISKIWLEDGKDERVKGLRSTDGLVRYYDDGDDEWDGRPIYVHESSFWPHYRSRHHVATLVSVPEVLRTEPGIARCYETWRRLDKLGRFERLRGCREVLYLAREKPPLQKLFMHPLLKALCWPMTMMEKEEATLQGQSVKDAPDPWYQNIR